MKSYRNITPEEIKTLERQGCWSKCWDKVMVVPDFLPDHIRNTTFSGSIFLGSFNENIMFDGGVAKKAGIHNAHLHNCVVGNNVFISNIGNYIANYDISDHVIIENTALIVVSGYTAFGNGTRVDVLDETGGRKLMIYDSLSAPMAYIMTFYRHHDHLPESMEEMIRDYASEVGSDRGFIGERCTIMNCGHIENVRLGPHTRLQGVSRLKEGSVNSNIHDPVFIGNNVVAEHFIISSGSEIDDHAMLSHCFVGQSCSIGKHYSAVHSIFFCNCQGFNGEACSIFAGPFTVTHHKSTLLIAGMFSFANAGSGSNQSNHMYKLGPIHHGIVERGSKTTSDSYLLWPAKIGPFTLVMGRHYKNPDTSCMPFSYLIERNDESWLSPGVNLRSVGTVRDAMKWPRRDKRRDPEVLDPVNFNLLSPYTVQRMIRGKQTLENLRTFSGDSTETYSWETVRMTRSSLLRGIRLYHMGILKFLGNSVISRIEKKQPGNLQELRRSLEPDTNCGRGDWIDLSGLIAPKSEIENLIHLMQTGKIKTLNQINRFIKELHARYYEYEWTWASELLCDCLKKSLEEILPSDLTDIVNQWKTAVVELDQMLYEDARKEFRLSAMTGFGPDGNMAEKEQDFIKVRGTFEKNTFVMEILDHIHKKSELGDRTLKFLDSITI